MEHELSAYYDITHGVGLAILTPRWMRYILNEDTVEKFVDYAKNVWGIAESEDVFETANAGIDATENIFEKFGNSDDADRTGDYRGAFYRRWQSMP